MSKHMRERHPVIPHLSRVRTPATDLWPLLRKVRQPPPRPKQQGSTLCRHQPQEAVTGGMNRLVLTLNRLVGALNRLEYVEKRLGSPLGG
jgi:hypothetical protein